LINYIFEANSTDAHSKLSYHERQILMSSMEDLIGN